MKVSIVIVNWNTRDLLLQCIGSLQKFANGLELEILVVDNASADGSVEAVRRDYPQVKLLPQTSNLGFSKANNIGIRESTGSIVCLVNSDIEVRDGATRQLADYLEAHPEVGMVGPRLRGKRGEVQQHTWRFPTLMRSFGHAVFMNVLMPYNGMVSRKIDLNVAHPLDVDVSPGAFCMVRRQALDEVGLLDEHFFFYGEDIDWCRRFRKAGWKIHHLPMIEVIHYGGASTSMAPIKYHLQFNNARLQYWRKHEPRLVLPAFYSVVFLHHSLRILVNSLAMVWDRKDAERRRYNLQLAWKALTWLFNRSKPISS